MHGPRAVLALCAGIALLLGGSSLAWACTPTARITLDPTEGRAGSQVLVTGEDFGPTVQIHWDSVDGPVLERTTGPSFSVWVTVPDAEPDVYTFVATSTVDGTAYKASAAFEVIGQPARDAGDSPSGGESSSDPPASRDGEGEDDTTASGGATDDGRSQGGQTSLTTGGQMPEGDTTSDASTSSDEETATTSDATADSAPAEQEQAAEDTAPAGQAPATDGQAAGTEPPAPEPDPPAMGGEPASEQAQSRGDRSVSAEAGTDRGGEPAREGAPPAGAAGGPASSPVEDRLGDPVARLPARSAATDLWSGFTSSEPTGMSPGLGGTAGQHTAGGALPGQLTAALVLLGAGLLVALTGLGATARRRRAIRS